MNKRERLLTAIGGGTPDRVPVSAMIHWRFAERLLGRYHWTDVIEAHRRVGSIPAYRLPVSIGPNSDYDERWGMESRILKQEEMETVYERTIRNRKGELRSIQDIGFDSADPTLGFCKEYFVKEPKDWDVIEAYWEDELENAGMPEHEEINEARDMLGDDGVAGAIINSSYGRIALMRGMEGQLLDFYDIPDRMHALMDLAWKQRQREIQSFLESKADVLSYDICWATGANISPQMFREWVYPDICRVCEMVRKVPDKYVGLYTLGRIGAYFDMMVEAKPHFVASFEQNQGDITLAEAKKRVDNRVCLIGNFDPLILQNGTLEDARREARRCLDEGMEGGGYVLGTGDEVPPTAKLDNLKAMAEVAEEHGRY